MANPHRGEVELAAGELGSFTLVLDNNALAEIQGAMGLATGSNGDMAFLERLPMTTVATPHDVRLVLFAGLQRHHGARAGDGRAPTIWDAGEVMNEIGIEASRAAISEAMAKAFPEPGAEPPPKKSAEPWSWRALVAQASKAGVDTDRFWRMTLREVADAIKASVEERHREFREIQAGAWFGVYYDRVKKMPKLDSILSPSEELNPEDRAARQISKLQALAQATGGVVERMN